MRVKQENLFYHPSQTEKFLVENTEIPLFPKRMSSLWEKWVNVEGEDGRTGKVLVTCISGTANSGNRYTYTLVFFYEDGIVWWGYRQGFRFPVPILYSHAKHSLKMWLNNIRRLPAKSLLPMEEVPGFLTSPTPSQSYPPTHKLGWHSKGVLAAPLGPHAIFPEAKLFLIQEGIYIFFPDESIRLIPHKEWERFLRDLKQLGVIDRPPDLRQGDLLMWDFPPYPFHGTSPIEGPLRIDRHEVVCKEFYPASCAGFYNIVGGFSVNHPQHGELKATGEVERLITLLPGTSYPFQGGVD